MKTKTICVFDSLDHCSETTDNRIEIQANMANGAFQTVAVVDLEKMDPKMFHGVFKVCITGQDNQSKDAPLP